VPGLAFNSLESVEVRLYGHSIRIVDYIIMVGEIQYEVGCSLQLDFTNVPSLFIGILTSKDEHGGLGLVIEQ